MSEVMRPHKATQSRCQGLVLCFFFFSFWCICLEILWSYDPRPCCIYLTVVWSINHTDSFWSTKPNKAIAKDWSKARLALLDCWLLRSQSQMKERSTECYTNWTDCPGNAYYLKRGFILWPKSMADQVSITHVAPFIGHLHPLPKDHLAKILNNC